MKRVLFLGLLLFITACTLSSCSTFDPFVFARDQEIINSSVIIADISSVVDPSWVVIHASTNGEPGAVIGQTSISAGDHLNVSVQINEEQATETLFAMLHLDTGVIGKFEFPGVDVPTKVSGNNIAIDSFKIIQPVVEEVIEEMKEEVNETVEENISEEPVVEINETVEEIIEEEPVEEKLEEEVVEEIIEEEPSIVDITMIASQWQFDPSTITVKEGDTIILNIETIDVSHRFSLPAFGIDLALEPEQPVNTEFIADQKGSFTFSSDHDGMEGTLIVE